MQIEWLPSALVGLRDTLDYGLTTFGESVVRQFYRQLDKTSTLLLANPRMGKREPLTLPIRQKVRSIVFHRHYKLVYYVEGDLIRIVALFDTRRNPTSLGDYFR